MANAAQQSSNPSASEQDWQVKLNSMDKSFSEATEIITQCRTALARFKNQTSSGQNVTWNNLEEIDQQLASALTRVYQTRSSLPIGVQTN